MELSCAQQVSVNRLNTKNPTKNLIILITDVFRLTVSFDSGNKNPSPP